MLRVVFCADFVGMLCIMALQRVGGTFCSGLMDGEAF